MVIERYSVFLVELNPIKESEIAKTRPCVVISPNEANQTLRTVIVAPLTSITKTYPTRVGSEFNGQLSQIALDQIRAVDKSRLRKHIGMIDDALARQVADALVSLFTY